MMRLLLLTAVQCLPFLLWGQNVGIGTVTPNANALLEVNAGNKGVLIPRVPLVAPANASPFTNPPVSLLLYNTSFNDNISPGYFYWSGTEWLRLMHNKDAWNTTGNAGTNASTHFIGTKDDVSLSFRIRNVNSGLIDSNLNRTTFGFATGRPASGVHNSAFGFNALSRHASQASSNTAIGSLAMEAFRTGSFNAALGMSALYRLDSGSQNTSIGNFSMSFLTTGRANTAVGGNSMFDMAQGDSNTVTGYRATVKTQVSRSTAIGALAVAGRSDVIVLGSVPGENQATRGVDVGIGTINPQYKLHIVDGNSTGILASGNTTLLLDKAGGSNHLSMLVDANSEAGLVFGKAGSIQPPFDGGIFYNTGGQGAFQFRNSGGLTRMVIDATGQVGIGTGTPSHRLHVSTNDAQNAGFRQGILIENTATGTDGQGNINTGEAAISFKNAGANGTGNNQWIVGLNQNRNMAFAYGTDFNASTTRMVLDSTGNLGIGVTAPTFQLQLSQNSAAKPGSNTWTVSSDARLKKNMHPFSDGMEVLEKIRPIWFTYTGAENHPQEQFVGTTAQELQQVAPYMVTILKKESSVGKNLLGVDYGPLQFIMVNALKQQQELIKNQQREIDLLKERLDRMERNIKK